MNVNTPSQSNALHDPFDAPGHSAERMRAFDWSATALGAPHTWSPSLRTIVQMMLRSRFAMWMAWGPELTFFCNDAYAPTLGMKQNWAIGARSDKVWEEIWPDIGPRIRSVFETNTATWDEGLLLFLERSGYAEETYHTFSYSPLTDVGGEVAGMLCVVTEETERVIAQRRVATLQRLAALTSSAETVEDACTLAMEALSANSCDFPYALVRLFDDARSEAVFVAGLHVSADHSAIKPSIRVRDEPRLADALTTHALIVAPLDGEESATLPTGAWRRPIVEAFVAPMIAKSEAAVSGYFAGGLNPHRLFDQTYRDFLALVASQIASAIANANRFQEERRRVEALAEIDRSKTAFFSNVSHEFRTPLTLMLGPLEDAMRDRPTPALEMAHRNGLRLLRLVNALLDFSRAEAGRVSARFEPTDLARATTDLASAFRAAFEKAGIAFVVDCPPLDSAVAVDRDMWEKIVLNLVSNAFKFTLSGSVKVELRQVGSRVRLRVVDTGVGIPEAELTRVFERFHRIEGQHGRTHEGTGIGLALVSDLVTLHGGSIRVESEPGRQTTFEVDIPARSASAGPVAVGQSVHARSFVEEALRWLPDFATSGPVAQPGDTTSDNATTIVLADDNADMRAYVTGLLEDAGFAVWQASDGEEALDLIRARRPKLVLSDVMMPKLDGLALVGALRADPQFAHTPIILLSARFGEDAQVEGLDSGADDYITKPFVARELVARVRTNVAQAEARARLFDQIETSAAQIRRILDALPILASYVDVDEHYVFVNRSYERWFSKTKEEVCGRTMREVLGDRAYAVLQPHVRKALDGELAHFSAEVDYQYGGRRFIEASYLPDTDAVGRVVGFFVFVEDATERRDGIIALEKSEALKSAILNTALDAIVAIDETSRIVEFNAAAERTFGVSRAEAMGRYMPDLIMPSEHRSQHEAGVARYLRTGHGRVLNRRVDLEALRADGTRFPAEVSIAATDVNGERRFTAYMRDVSDKRRADLLRDRQDAALAESERRFRDMSDNAPVMIWVTDKDGRCTYLNQRWYEFTGQSEAQGLGLGWLEATHSDDKEKAGQAFFAANAEHAPFSLEYRLRRADGEYRHCLDAALPRLDADGAFLGYIGSVIDISERKQAEDRRLLLIHELNHRVKNTLTVVQSLALQGVRASQHNPAAFKDDFVRRLSALAQAHDVLTQQDWAGADLEPLVAQSLAPFASMDRYTLSGQRIRLSPRAAVPLAMAFHELATNAAKYGALANDAGAVTIGWRIDKDAGQDWLTLTWTERGGPMVKPPERRGFGSRLIDQGLRHELDGDVRMEFAATGLVCAIRLPLSAVKGE